MEFEFDVEKSPSNLAKHGIGFVEAQRLWEDTQRLEIRAHSTQEERWIVIGRIDEILWSAVVTYRVDRIRLISVRRSRSEENALYESEGV